MTPVGLSPNHLWVVPICALNSAGVRSPRLMWGAIFVVVPPPAFDPDLGLHPVPKPLEGQAFVPELPVERFVRAILPGLARIDELRVDLRSLQPAEQRGRDALRAVI